MSYTPNSPAWADETGIGDGTPITAVRLNHIETGLDAVSDEVDVLIASATSQAFAFFIA